MFARISHKRIRLLTILISVLAIAALATPGFAATPKGSGSASGDANGQQVTNSPDAYALQGDTSNSGTGITNFSSSYGSSGAGAWYFTSSSSTDGSVSLRAYQSSATNGTALWAQSTNGRGVYAQHLGTTGAGAANAAVYGNTVSTTGSAYAIYGEVTPTSPGGSSTGVRGQNNGTSGSGIGVWGSQNGSGWGVLGTSVSGLGVYGSSTSGYGVYGASSGSYGVYGGGGTNGYGVYGAATGTSSFGVYGSSGNVGVYGTATGAGIYGISTSGYGVYGTSGYIGVYGTGTNYGVYGISSSGNGVYGTSSTGVALFGSNSGSGSGFYGYSANGPGGVMGSNTTEGARFYTRNSSYYALITGSLPNTYGHVYVTGNLHVTGTCCSSVKQSDGSERQMYAVEFTQNVYSDQGTAQLVNGRAVINIDPVYAAGVNLSAGYQVFVTPKSFDTLGLAVGNETATSFEVRELGKGTGNFSFDWRIDALRTGHETERMAPAMPAPTTGGSVYDVPDAPVIAPAVTAPSKAAPPADFPTQPQN